VIDMICYMPFTHIEEPHLKLLAGAFGSIALYSPADTLVPERMRQWEQAASLEIRHPCRVDGERLKAIVRDYKSWARMHQGRIGDMAGFIRSRPERFVLMEDTNPSQIRHQVRHYGESQDGEAADPLIDAALFLSLTQEFDTQQYAMERELDAVRAQERRMMERMTGYGSDEGDGATAIETPPVAHRDYAFSPQMIPQRVRAWSMLALKDSHFPWLYLTLSRPVVEHLLDRFAQVAVRYDQPLVSTANQPVMPAERMRALVQALAEDATDPAIESLKDRIEAPTDQGEPASASGMRLIIYQLTGITPRVFLETLAGQRVTKDHDDRQDGAPDHTLVGLVTADGIGADAVRSS
jgi:hypothetical protein